MEMEEIKSLLNRDERLHDDMSVFGTEAVRAILLVNGAAAVALVAILPYLWDKKNLLLLLSLLIGLVLLAVGASAAASLNYYRIEAFDAMRSQIRHIILLYKGPEKDREEHSRIINEERERIEIQNKKFRCRYKKSFRCFGTAIGIVVFGAFLQLICEFTLCSVTN